MKLLFSFLFATIALFGAEFSVTNISELRQALKDAENNNESDTISLKSGLYLVDGEQLEYNSSESLEIVGVDDNVTLSGGNSSRILYINPGNSNDVNFTIKISNLTFVDGNSSGHGGAVYIYI